MDENLFEVDPNLLTIPKLKAILSENGVQLPMRNEKKAFYVDLFRKHITAKADTIRKRQQAIKPSSAGIMAVSSRGSPLVNEKLSSSIAAADQEEDNIFQSTGSARKKFDRKTPESSSPLTSRMRKRTVQTDNESPPPEFQTPQKHIIAGYVDPRQLYRKKDQSVKQNNVPLLKIFSLLLAFVGASVTLHHLYAFRTLKYCPVGTEAPRFKSILGVPLSLPECRQCPAHAVCKDGSIENCDDGYILYQPLFPFHPRCEPDVVKFENIEKLAETLKAFLSDHAGAVECGETLGNTYLLEKDAKRAMAKEFSSWSPKQFEEYWNWIVKDLQGRRSTEAIAIKLAVKGESRILYSTDPNYSLICRAVTFMGTQKQNVLVLLLSVALFFTGKMYFNKMKRERQFRRELVDAVTKVLIEQDNRFRSGLELQSALSISQLRDFFLLNRIKNLKTRVKTWQSVRKELLENCNIRETVIMLGGEQHDAWQWIGGSLLLSPVKH